MNLIASDVADWLKSRSVPTDGRLWKGSWLERQGSDWSGKAGLILVLRDMWDDSGKY